MTGTEEQKTVQDKKSNKAVNAEPQQKYSRHRAMHSKNMWFAFITVFISGAAIGASCIAFILKPSHPGITNPGPDNNMVQSRIMPHMTKTLNLSPAQQNEAEKIMMNMSNQLHEIRKKQAPEIQKIIQSSFADIEQLLNEKQKVKFIEMQKRIKSCHARGRGRGFQPSSYRGGKMPPPERKYLGRGRMMSKQKNSTLPKEGQINE